jgi:hypothetical protein
LSKIRLTSLLLVEERLLEADYFLKRVRRQNDSKRMGFELNAFLSACRSASLFVTYVPESFMWLPRMFGFARWRPMTRCVIALGLLR